MSIQNTTIQRALPYTVFPVLMIAGVGIPFAVADAGGSFVLSFGVVTLLLFVLIAGFERIMPRRPEWASFDGLEFQDTGHSVFGTILGGKLGEYFTSMVFPILGLAVAGAGRGSLWPRGLPMGFQIVLVFLLADLGRYIQHRAMHLIPLLWRFHSLHHSVERLTVWKTSRSHIVERVFQQLFMFGPLIAAGVPSKVLMFYIIPNTYLGLFAHSNLDVRLGPFENVFMGPGAHRIHHSQDDLEGNSNFGSALVVWDRVFRTYIAPMNRPDPLRVGIAQDRTPRGFFAQLVQPFRRSA